MREAGKTMPIVTAAMAAAGIASMLAPGLVSFAVRNLTDVAYKKIIKTIRERSFAIKLQSSLEDELKKLFESEGLTDDDAANLIELGKWLGESGTIDKLFAISTRPPELLAGQGGDTGGDFRKTGRRQAGLLDELVSEACKILEITAPSQQQDKMLRLCLAKLSSGAFELFWSLLDDGEKLQARIIAKMLDEQTGELKRHGGFAEYVENSQSSFWKTVEIQKRSDYRSRLYYRLEHARFHGREKELARLREFCVGGGEGFVGGGGSDDRKFKWWALTGAGGTGKSRLAFEFAKRLREDGWHVFFADKAFLEKTDFPNWQMAKDLLVVVDYAQKYPELVSDWIRKLTSTHATLNKRLRLLIIERDSGDEALWFTQGGFGTGDLPDWRYQAHESLLELGALSPWGLMDFAFNYLRDANRQDTDELVAAAILGLFAIDRKLRLLYLVMILDTLMEHDIEDIRDWSKDDLTKYVVKRELEAVDNRYNTLGLDGRQKDACKRILAFCTATKGWPYDALPGYIGQNLACLGNLAAADKPIALGAERAADGSYALAPFEPDIVGEHLTCRILKECLTTPAQRQELIDAAWTAAPEEFKFFLYRLEQDGLHADGTDYPTAVDQLFRMPGRQCGRPALLEYCELLWGSMHLLPLDRQQENVERLQNIYDDSGGDDEIALALAKGLANLAAEQDAAGAAESVGRIQGLYDGHGGAEIALELAKGLANLECVQEEQAAALASCNRIAELVALFPDSAEIAEVYRIVLEDYHRRFGK
jgi:hypothetical protein